MLRIFCENILNGTIGGFCIVWRKSIECGWVSPLLQDFFCSTLDLYRLLKFRRIENEMSPPKKKISKISHLNVYQF